MLCSHGNRVLRTFRSHKNLKSSSEESRQYQIQHIHRRQPSECESMATSRSSSEESRPSTSRTDKSSDWDPLRSHPPMDHARSPYIYPSSHSTTTSPSSSPRRYRFEQDGSTSTLHRRARSFRDLQASSNASLEIHDGFDFGFGSHDSTPVPAYGRQPKSAWSSTTVSRSSSVGSDTSSETVWGGAIIPRPQTRHDDPGYFMKRGQWKRRGIVFASEVPVATEEDCFDLP